MIRKALALLRDVTQAHPIASESETKWLETVWHGHLAALNEDAKRQVLTAGWWSALLQPLCCVLLLAAMCWLTWRI